MNLGLEPKLLYVLEQFNNPELLTEIDLRGQKIANCRILWKQFKK